MSGSNLLFILTGSIAGFKACEAISQLVQRGHRVRTVATKAALQFIGPATLEGLTGSPVLTDLFAPGAALEHINLTRWADAVIVCPATANTINRFAAGLAEDLAGSLFLAHDRSKPFLIAPAMNPAMWAHPATTTAVEKLQQWGVRFLPVGEGRTACGEVGEGRLAEPAQIVIAVEASLAKPVRRLRVLVTSGGTAEPIDGVRVLTNTSTGSTGAGIASHLTRCGHDVVLLRARSAVKADNGVRDETFSSFAELDSALHRFLGSENFDAVIHAAAVSDFGVESVVTAAGSRPPGPAKIESGPSPVTVRLHVLPKLVDSLRNLSRNPDLKLVAFKLTANATPEETSAAVQTLLQRTGANFVVHNDLSQRVSGEDFPATIYKWGGGVVHSCATRSELAEVLEKVLVATGPQFA
jgi:phosphopantothenoylcysteine decarboxylase/phosphopantothenate--cysteine ligase